MAEEMVTHDIAEKVRRRSDIYAETGPCEVAKKPVATTLSDHVASLAVGGEVLLVHGRKMVMKRRLVVVAVLGALISVLLGAMTAFGSPVDEHDQPFPEHPHVLVLGVELDPVTEEPVSIRKCVDLAANRALPLNAHHVHVHFGTAGFKLATNASNFVIPTAPFPGVPWTDCESLLAIFGF